MCVLLLILSYIFHVVSGSNATKDSDPEKLVLTIVQSLTYLINELKPLVSPQVTPSSTGSAASYIVAFALLLICILKCFSVIAKIKCKNVTSGRVADLSIA